MEPTSYNAERQGASGQGAQWIFGTDKFSDEDHARIQQALNTALSWDQINSRPGGGGKKVPYLAGHTVIENANKVFGFAGWDSSILHLSLDYLEKSEDGRFWMAGATAIVRITVANGCGHEDVGNSHMKDRDKGEVLSRVKKAAVTDAKKRALRLFGTQLGSQMMDKEGLKETEITHKQNQRELKANQQREARMRKEQMQQQQQQQQSHHDQTGGSPRSDVHPAGRPPPQQQQQQQQQQQRSHTPNSRPHTPQPGQQRPPLAGSGGGGGGGGGGAPPPQASIPQHSPRVASGNSSGGGGGGGGGSGCGSASSPRVVPQQIPPVPSGGGGPTTTAPGAAAAVAGRGPLSESSPNKAAAFRNNAGGNGSGSGSGSGSSAGTAGHRRFVDPVVDPAGGGGGGGGAPAMPSLPGSPAFDYAVGDGGGDGGTSRPPGEPPTTTAARGGGGGGGDGGCGGEGDEYDMSQADFGSAFMEIDSLIQQHNTSSLSGGSPNETLAAGAGAVASGGGGDVGGGGDGLAMAIPMHQRQGQNNNFKRLRT